MLIIKKIIFYSILLILVVPFVFAAEREITLTNLKVLDASGNPLVDSDGDGDFDIAQNTQFIFKFDMQNTGSVGLGSETQGVIIGLTNSIALEPDVSTRLSFVLPVGSILSNQIIGPLKFESIAGPGIYSFILDSWATYIIVPGDASITPIKIDFPGGANYINLEHKFVGFVTPTGQTREEIWASQNPNKVYGYSVSLKNNNPISDYSGKYYLYTYGSPDYCRIFNAQFTLAPEEEQIFTISLPLCSDGLDNDGDLLTDYSADPGCYDSYDNDETDGANPPAAGPFPECSDRYDNDRDGKIDYPSDPGCTSFDGTNENNDPVTLTLCNDNADNDKDGFFDLDDPGCLDAADNDETDPATPPECADNMDNDGDGRVDNYGYRATKGYYAAANDPACGAAGQTEKNVLEQCSDGIDNDGDGLTDYPADPGCYIKFDALETNLGCPMKEYENHYFDIIGADGVRPFSTAPRYDKYITNANLWYTGPMPPFINDPDLKFSPTDNIEIYSIQRGLMQGIPANSIFHIWAWDKKTRYKLFDQSFIIPSGFFYYGTIPETSPNTLVYGGVTYNSYKYLGNVKFEANMCKLENNYCETNPPDPEHTEVPSQLDLFYEYLLPEPMTNRLGGPNLANPGGYGAMPRNFAVTAVHKCLVKDNNGCGCTSALDTILKILKKSCVMSGSDIIVNRIYSGLFQFSAALEAELNERILKVESKDPAGNIQEITDYILGNSIE
ncbi:hypothetical protein J4427_01625, partial [Candidatus Woesearchaeota archaeon]|nr:hypothetical protein [Candidatus Woesearchaeota archaeon]